MLHFARRDRSPSAAALPSSGHPPPASSVPTPPLLRRIQAPDPRPHSSATITPNHDAPSATVPSGPPPPRPARRPPIDHRLCSPPDLPRFTLPVIAGMPGHNPKSQTLLPKPLTLSEMQNQNAASAERKLPPPWIDSLMWSSFFERCSAHPDWYGSNRRCPAKNGCTYMCTDCGVAICARCTQEGHRGHRAVQIRVSSFQNVVKVEDIKPFFDLAQVQTHRINGFRVVCINTRPKTPGTGRWRGSGIEGVTSSTCKVCSRVLKGIHAFCSIECKVSDCTSAAAVQRRNAEAAVAMMSGARKRARKAPPQRAHLGCTL